MSNASFDEPAWRAFPVLDDIVSGSQIFEEPILQFIDCKQPDPNNQLLASPQEQLMGSAKFNIKRQSSIALERSVDVCLL